MLFRGSAPALVTPFKDGQVDWDAYKQILDFQLEEGSDALVVCGTTGEPSTLTKEERLALIEVTVDHVRGAIPVIAGCGGNNTASVIEMAASIEALNADALLTVTPYYNKTTQEGLFQHYRALDEAVETPIIVYNVPARTALNIDPHTMSKIADLDHVVAIKEASGSISQIMEVFRLCRDKVAIYSGNDDHVYPMLALGGAGVISVAANVVPRAMHDMVALFADGDQDSSLNIQLELLPLISALFCEVSPIPVKAAVAMLGLAENELRLPLVPMSAPAKERLRVTMSDLALI